MNISSLNSYNTSFQAKHNKAGKYARAASNTRKGAHASKHYSKTAQKQVKVAIGGAILTAAALAAIFIPKNNDNKAANAETMPTYSITETYEQETQGAIKDLTTTKVQTNQSTMKVSTTPIEQREPKWHTVVAGDRLADIVKEYAEIDPNTPDYELEPYYQILEQDNPNKWENRDVIKVGTSFRVDGILPEYRIDSYVGYSEPTEETTTSTESTEETQATSKEDTITLNGLTFEFDINTMHKEGFDKYEGKMFGKHVVIDKKLGGKVVETRHTEASADSPIATEITYDKDGKITQILNYENGKAETLNTYTYHQNTYVVNSTDLTTDKNQISVIETTYSNSDNSVKTRTFKSSKGTVAEFDFNLGTLKIGDNAKEIIFNYETFKCNDNEIGSAKYTGSVEFDDVRIDVLKNGICIEYVDGNGDIISREQYNAKGELIEIE